MILTADLSGKNELVILGKTGKKTAYIGQRVNGLVILGQGKLVTMNHWQFIRACVFLLIHQVVL